MRTKLPTNAIALLECFLFIAETPNISQAAKAMRISRVTLQSRLKQLEKLCGYELLELDSHNRYKLTPRAENWVQEVKVWLRRGEDIFSLPDERATGLLQNLSQTDGEVFYFQQHPLNSLWEHDAPYFETMIKSWLAAKGQYGDPALEPVRNNAIFARLHEDKFIIMEIGKDAAMMDWLGPEWCLSAIGKPLTSTPMTSRADQIIMYSYRQTMLQGTPLYDHVIADLPRPELGTIERAYYRRLVLPCKLPDGSSVIASVVELSDDLVIGDLEVPSKRQSTGES